MIGGRSANLSGNVVMIDELRVGGSWRDVVPADEMIPEPATLLLAALGVSGLAGYARRRRRC
jgi:hypothetical protein